jgi:photosystem I subunit XI
VINYLLVLKINMDYIKPYKGDPQEGNLSTPISDSAFTKAFIGNLPAYRKGLSPLTRGLEVGLAHGYFLLGPWYTFGPLRDSEYAALGAFVSAVTLILIATVALSAHGSVSLASSSASGSDTLAAYSSADRIKTAEGWSEFAGGFFVGGAGGAFVAYFLIQNLSVVDAIFRGLVN